MKVAKNKIFYGIISIFILLVSLTFSIVDFIVPLNFWTHPVLNFAFLICLGFGLFGIIYGLKNKASMFVLAGAFLLGLASYYAFFQYLGWFMPLIIVFTIWAIFAIIGYVRIGIIAEQALNDSPEYKADLIKNGIGLNGDAETEELPEIKSFK